MLGSPPQVRGKPHSLCNFSESFRITPAGAGKTITGAQYISTKWDHPRRCGENKMRRNVDSGKCGSPPQVRGKPEDETEEEKKERITPAGAGKT